MHRISAISLFAVISFSVSALNLAEIERAYADNPGDMRTAYAWVRAHVEARKNLAEKIMPRQLPKEIPAEWRYIVDGPKWPDESRKISRDAALADLDYLEEMIANCYSYADRRGADWRGALDALRASITGEIGAGAFKWRISRFLNVFGDPHTRFETPVSAAPTGRLPAIFAYHGERILALKADRSAFLNADAPYVTAIGGIGIAKWLSAASDSVPKCSPQFERFLIARTLSRTEELAWQVGLKPEAGRELEITLTSADGKLTATEKLALVQPQRDANPPDRNESRRTRAVKLPPPLKTKKIGDIGYLHIMQMDREPEFIAALDKAMADFKDTRGLIIDVRDNGGGSQDAIKTLLPYFMKKDEPMKIVNIAAYRLPLPLPKPNPEGFLGFSGRSLHPATSKVWTDAQRSIIAEFMKTWEPRWKLPAGKFSDWHFMAISRATNPNAFDYDKPVVVLQDEGCFSATDNFLGALKGHRNVTLLGTTSGGGSGRMAGYAFPNLRSEFSLCQMASFAANGQTYDGIGVAPDVVVYPEPEDALRGAKDTILQEALKRLGAKPDTGTSKPCGMVIPLSRPDRARTAA